MLLAAYHPSPGELAYASPQLPNGKRILRSRCPVGDDSSLKGIHSRLQSQRNGADDEVPKPHSILNTWGLGMEGCYGVVLRNTRRDPTKTGVPTVVISVTKRGGEGKSQDRKWLTAALQVREFLSQHFDVHIDPLVVKETDLNVLARKYEGLPEWDVVREGIVEILSRYKFEGVYVSGFYSCIGYCCS